MVKKAEIYKCAICGNIVEVLKVGGGELVCCGKAMNCLEEYTEGDKAPKHLPVITKEDGAIVVALGEYLIALSKRFFIAKLKS